MTWQSSIRLCVIPTFSYNPAVDHFTRIYQQEAAAYHRLIAAEDADGNLAACLRERILPGYRRALDLGTGTGRLPLLLAKQLDFMVGMDLHQAMLQENVAQRKQSGLSWQLLQGDMRGLPFPDQSFDFITAGWAIGHLTGWYPESWQAEVDRVLLEMLRVTAPNGCLVIIETLSTGSTVPAPPTPALGKYYQRLEKEYAFTRQVIATDYVFPNAATAAHETAFFFGSELAEKIITNDWQRLPEFTGVWTKRL
jgi:ubiquinone/menaquinone biosynthesis C-methylase UbiE